MHIEHAAVGVVRAIQGLNRGEFEPVVHVLADCIERIRDEVGHRQDGWSGVEAIATINQQTVAAPGNVFTFDDGDLSTGACQPKCSAEASQTRTDDHNAISRPRNSTKLSTQQTHD